MPRHRAKVKHGAAPRPPQKKNKKLPTQGYNLAPAAGLPGAARPLPTGSASLVGLPLLTAGLPVRAAGKTDSGPDLYPWEFALTDWVAPAKSGAPRGFPSTFKIAYV